MDKENIENQSPVGLSAMSGPSVGHTVEVPSSSLAEVGLGQEGWGHQHQQAAHSAHAQVTSDSI